MDLLKKYNILPLLDQCVVSGGNALVQVLLLRVLGIETYGLLAFIMIFILGLVALNQAIIITPFQVLYSKEVYKQGNDNEINGLQLQLIIIYVLLLLIAATINQWVHFLASELVIPTIVYGLSYLLTDYLRKKLYVLEKYRRLLIQDTSVFLANLIVVGSAFFLDLDLSTILLMIGVKTTVIVVVFWGKWSLKQISVNVYLEHWEFSKWLIASTITQWFSGNLIISIAGVIIGNWAVGVIRIGQTINGVLGVLFQLMESYYPYKVAKVFNKSGIKELNKYLISLGTKSIGLTVLLALIIMIFSQYIIAIIYGEELARYAYIMYWFGSLLIVNVFNILLRFYIRTLNLNRLIFESYILLALFNALLAHYLVNYWGIHGVGFGLVASQVLASIWFIVRIKINKKEGGKSLYVKTSIW